MFNTKLPRFIRTKKDAVCAETKLPIPAGSIALYDPNEFPNFCMYSSDSQKFKLHQASSNKPKKR